MIMLTDQYLQCILCARYSSSTERGFAEALRSGAEQSKSLRGGDVVSATNTNISITKSEGGFNE